jgi:O-antigen ligase
VRELLENPLLLVALLALPLLLVVVPWRTGWLVTLFVFFWADSSMVGAPRNVRWRLAMLGLLFVQGVVRLRGRGRGAPLPVPVVALVLLAGLSTLWSPTFLGTAANSVTLGVVVVVVHAHLARYASSATLATDTMRRAVLLVLALLVVGFFPPLRADELLLAGRLRGFFANPNGLGVTCALVAPWVALRFARSAGAARVRAAVVLGALGLLALLSGSRTGVGGLLVGTASTLFLLHPSRVLFGAIVVGVATAIATLAGKEVDLESGPVGTLARADTVSRLSGRLERWEEGIERWKQAPFFGHGFRSSFGFETVPTRDAAAVEFTASGINYHSQHVENLADTGIVGEGLFLWVLFLAWRRARGLAKRRDDPALSGAGAAFVGTLAAATLDSFFHNWFLTPASPYSFFVWSTIGLCAGLHRTATRPYAGAERTP